jgi:hypothetical protein
MCHFSISASFSIIITNFHQKYVVLTAIRRSGGISKILLIKKLKSKVYVSFRIRLYSTIVHYRRLVDAEMFNIITQKHLITANPVFSLTYDSCMHCDTVIHSKLEFDSQQ